MLYTQPLDSITFEDVERFCSSGVREGVRLDFKREFPRKLEKSIAAFANTHGGIILVGVDETTTGQAKLPVNGIALERGLRERVVSIGLQSITPPVFPEVKVLELNSAPEASSPDRAVVLIRVAPSPEAPHAVENGTQVYFRVDNISDPYATATVDQVQWLLERRQKALKLKERVRAKAHERCVNNQAFLVTKWRAQGIQADPDIPRFVFGAVPTYPGPEVFAPHWLLENAIKHRFYLPIHCHEFPLGTSWRPVHEGVIFPDDYPGLLRYTELNQSGLIHHEYAFYWERRDYVFCRAMAELISASYEYGGRLYEAAGYAGLVDFYFQIVGARGKKLALPGVLNFSEYVCLDEEVEVTYHATVDEIRRGRRDLAKGLYRRVLWAFGWNPHDNVIEHHTTEVGF